MSDDLTIEEITDEEAEEIENLKNKQKARGSRGKQTSFLARIKPAISTLWAGSVEWGLTVRDWAFIGANTVGE